MDFAGQTLIRSLHRERELKHSHNALEIAVEVTLPAQGARIETSTIYLRVLTKKVRSRTGSEN